MKKKNPAKAVWVPVGTGDWSLRAADRDVARVEWRLDCDDVRGDGHEVRVWELSTRLRSYRSLAAAKRAAEDDARSWLTAALKALPKRKAGAR